MQVALTYPSVSWLLCTNKIDDHFYAAVESCLNQTFADFELIIVVNGEDAQTLMQELSSIAGSDSRIRIFSTSIRHLIFSLNLGLHHANANLIARMDSDDIAYPDRLRLQVEFMRSRPNVAVLGTAFTLIDEFGNSLKTIVPPTADRNIRQALLRGNPLCHPSVMFRKDVVMRMGGYMGGIHAEDYDLWVRVSTQPDLKFANLEAVCLGYRADSGGEARRSRQAYASVTAAQLRSFLIGGGWGWGLAVIFSIIKIWTRSK